MGNWLIGIGVALAALGCIINYAPWLLNWFGKLPGDIRIEGENSTLFIPITSMLVVSVLLSLALNLFFRR